MSEKWVAYYRVARPARDELRTHLAECKECVAQDDLPRMLRQKFCKVGYAAWRAYLEEAAIWANRPVTI